MTMSNKTYDKLKWIAQILLPALGAAYFALAQLWNLPRAAEVVGTLTIVDTFLGVILGLSTAQYKASSDGRIIVDSSNPQKDVVAFDFTHDIADLIKQKTVTFTVERGTARPVPTATDDSADL